MADSDTYANETFNTLHQTWTFSSSKFFPLLPQLVYRVRQTDADHALLLYLGVIQCCSWNLGLLTYKLIIPWHGHRPPSQFMYRWTYGHPRIPKRARRGRARVEIARIICCPTPTRFCIRVSENKGAHSEVQVKLNNDRVTKTFVDCRV